MPNIFYNKVNVSLGSVVLECRLCKIQFGISERFYEDRKQRCDLFYCPNGHKQCFGRGKSDLDKAKEELEREKRRSEHLRKERERERVRADSIERRRRAAKGQLTKIRNRVGKGVCPCCNRHFENLQRHMATKHPSFGEGEA